MNLDVKFNEQEQTFSVGFDKEASPFSSDFGEVHTVTTSDHTRLTNLDVANQHPMSAITGLEEALAEIELTPGPAGSPGQDGRDGNDGITPHIGTNGNWWVGDTDTGVQARGKDGETGPAGADGKDGSDGKDGYTPVRGTDYWTEADKAEVVNAVLAALPAAEGVSF